MSADAFHSLVTRRIKELRAEGEEARADRLEQALKRADELLQEVSYSGLKTEASAAPTPRSDL